MWYFRATSLPASHHSPVFFHVNRQCLERGDTNVEPWGYFSLNPSSIENRDTLAVERKEDHHLGYRLTYDSIVEGVSATTVYVQILIDKLRRADPDKRSDCVLFCAQLNLGEVRLLKWLINFYSDKSELNDDSTDFQITEID